jgi:hypothetical protein
MRYVSRGLWGKDSRPLEPNRTEDFGPYSKPNRNLETTTRTEPNRTILEELDNRIESKFIDPIRTEPNRNRLCSSNSNRSVYKRRLIYSEFTDQLILGRLNTDR